MLLRGRWFDIILNVHSPTKDKSGDSNNSFNDELM